MFFTNWCGSNSDQKNDQKTDHNHIKKYRGEQYRQKFYPKKFGDIGTFGDMGTEIKKFVQKLKYCNVENEVICRKNFQFYYEFYKRLK